MGNNLDFWNKHKEVPKNALRDFNNGKFSGTDINTMWRLKCLTESFGMCGVGWYFKIIKTWAEMTPNNEMFAFVEIELFVKVNGEWSMPISGNGGNKLLRKTKAGESSSDEAYKMAVTDAIGVACRNLGMGADVYWENDSTKYSNNNNDNDIVAENKQDPKLLLISLAKNNPSYTEKIKTILAEKYNNKTSKELTIEECEEILKELNLKKLD